MTTNTEGMIVLEAVLDAANRRSKFEDEKGIYTTSKWPPHKLLNCKGKNSNFTGEKKARQ